jgi:DNA end-binding protein Ku
MRKKGVVGIARVVLQRRERIVMLEPFGKGLLAISLRYAYPVRSERTRKDEAGRPRGSTSGDSSPGCDVAM